MLGVQFEVPWSEERPEGRQQSWYANASEEIKKRHIRVNRILGEAVNKCVRECKFNDEDSEEKSSSNDSMRACVLINAVLDSIAQDQLDETDLNALREDPEKLEALCKGVWREKVGRRRKIKKRPLTGRWDPVDIVVKTGDDDDACCGGDEEAV